MSVVTDLLKIKELSWYLTIPFFTCALVIQDPAGFIGVYGNIPSLFGFVGERFMWVLGALLTVFFVWLFAFSRLQESTDVPLTTFFATFLLSIAVVGMAAHHIKLAAEVPPLNLFWFLGLASLAFNFYQLQNAPESETNN